MKHAVFAAMLLALLMSATQVLAQKDVADPLEHFLATAGPKQVRRVVDQGVARVTGDFNNDDLEDVALWQDADFGPTSGSVYLYFRRKDGRYTAAGTISVGASSLFKPVPVRKGSGRLVFCERRNADQVIARGYAVDAFIVSDLPKSEAPAICSGPDRSKAICREACADDAPPPVERLDVPRYRANGIQAWLKR
jgi:hypothetical protein